MMGERRDGQEALFYEFSLERHVPETHLLRAIDRFVDLDGVRAPLAPFYSETGRPSIDPELMIRMLIVPAHAAAAGWSSSNGSTPSNCELANAKHDWRRP